MSSDKILGIDLGTTNSAVAVMEAGQPEIIENPNGKRTTPSVVGFTEDQEKLVGQEAKNQIVKNPESTVRSIKRHMGEEDYTVTLEGEEYSPEQVSAMILQRLQDDAQRYLGDQPDRAVITVPAYFNDKERQATKNAGEIAGLEVERIINEPTAAAMAYGLDDDEHQTVLVYDLGGGTFDVTLLEIQDNIYDVVATGGDSNLGGDDWTEAIVEHLIDEFNDEYGIDLKLDPQAHQRVYDAAEEAKKSLSNREKTTINLPFITSSDEGPLHLERDLTREEFEEMTEHLVEQTEGPLQNVLNEGGVSLDDMDDILLVGGATRMPMIRKQLDYGRQSVNPDEVVSLGAAVQGGVINDDVGDTVLLDVTPLSVGVEVKGGLFKKLIPRNTTIPTEASKVFTTGSDNQTSVDVRVYQGEREIAEKNEFLGEFTLAGIPPASAGTPRIKVDFSIDENGILDVQAVDEGSGESKSITIEGGVGLSEDEVEKMREEAEQFEEKDREQREQIETRNTAEAALRKGEQILDEHSEEVEAEKIATLRNEMEKTREALYADSSEFEDLAEVTQGLEQAVEECGESVHTRVFE